ncbi:MAG: hypothetical protein JO326_11610, partial [Acetobacteraceae bacterium]|nr:hypothetical protein [Acetobacteraceae bacterium]
VSREEIVAAFYDVYRDLPPESLLVNSPTDLVRRLRERPDLAYFVDPAQAAPEDGVGTDSAAFSGMTREDIRAEIQRATAPLARQLEQLGRYVHKVHSFAEIADPKIEHLVEALRQEAARPRQTYPVAQPSARSLRDWLRPAVRGRHPFGNGA